MYKYALTWDFRSAPRSGTGQAKPSEQPWKTVMASIFSIICGGNVHIVSLHWAGK